jgi:uncharacterized protein (TIGR00661 family)
MATIALSLAGEGRGHASRAKTVIEHLRREHRVVLLAPSVAYDLLDAAYRDTPHVSVHRIPGLHFCYRGHRLDYLRSLAGAIPYLRSLRSSVSRIVRLLRQERPALAITDFEPLLPRAAERCDIPYLSLDHQHFLLTQDLSGLPWQLRWKAWLVGLPIPLFYRRQRRTIVSSFYAPPLKRGCRGIVQTGVLLRPEILAARPVVGRHLLVYLRRFVRPDLIRALQQCGREVRIYGLGLRPPEGNLRYCEVDEQNFLNDLVSCDAVISNAGNQLVGEALFLRKPLLALPETGNFEQAINAHFVRQVGAGDWVDFDRVQEADLREFLQRVPAFRQSIRPENVAGNETVLALIREELAAVESSRSPNPSFQAA